MSSITKSAGAGANVSDAGDFDWSNPGRITASDDSRSRVLGVGSNAVTWNTVQLVVGGSRAGANKSTGAAVPTTETVVNFGGSSDLWSLTPSVAQVKASNFGVAVRVDLGFGVTSQYLTATNFDFSDIPNDATIDGIEAHIEIIRFGGGNTDVDHIALTVYYTEAASGQPYAKRWGGIRHSAISRGRRMW